jgi:Adenylate and Guanylate cyclase catalytic domain
MAFVIVNTTSRIESTGEGGKIHVSQEFAGELILRGKSDWVAKREFKVEAKGKGALATFWLRVIESDGRSSIGSAYSCALTAQSSASSDVMPLPRFSRMPELTPLSEVEEASSPFNVEQEAARPTRDQAEPPAWDNFNDEMSV